MIALVLALRLLHIAAGIFWAGGAILNTFYLAPTVAATGKAGQSFMAHLVTKARLTAGLTLASYVTVLAGAALYWIDSDGFTSAWQTSGPGVGFGLGAIAGLIGFGYGQVVGKNATLLARLAGELEGPPTAEQAAKIGNAQRRMATASRISTGALIVAMLLMATARYWQL